MPDNEGSDRLNDLLPEGYIPLGFIVSIKALNADGEVVLVQRTSDGLNAWEAAGMAMSLSDDLRDCLREAGAVTDD